MARPHAAYATNSLPLVQYISRPHSKCLRVPPTSKLYLVQTKLLVVSAFLRFADLNNISQMGRSPLRTKPDVERSSQLARHLASNPQTSNIVPVSGSIQLHSVSSDQIVTITFSPNSLPVLGYKVRKCRRPIGKPQDLSLSLTGTEVSRSLIVDAGGPRIPTLVLYHFNNSLNFDAVPTRWKHATTAPHRFDGLLLRRLVFPRWKNPGSKIISPHHHFPSTVVLFRIACLAPLFLQYASNVPDSSNHGSPFLFADYISMAFAFRNSDCQLTFSLVWILVLWPRSLLAALRWLFTTLTINPTFTVIHGIDGLVACYPRSGNCTSMPNDPKRDVRYEAVQKPKYVRPMMPPHLPTLQLRRIKVVLGSVAPDMDGFGKALTARAVHEYHVKRLHQLISTALRSTKCYRFSPNSVDVVGYFRWNLTVASVATFVTPGLTTCSGIRKLRRNSSKVIYRTAHLDQILRYHSNHRVICDKVCHDSMENPDCHGKPNRLSKMFMYGAVHEPEYDVARTGARHSHRKLFDTGGEWLIHFDFATTSKNHRFNEESLSKLRTKLANFPICRDLVFEDIPWKPSNHDYEPGTVGLHNEIKDFYNYIKPTDEEQYARDVVVSKIKDVVHSMWPDCEVDVFGSFKTGLYLPTSDIDMVIFGKWEALPLHTLKHALSSSGISSEITVLDKATVPIVKMTDKETGLKVDISFNMINSVRAAVLIQDYMRTFPCMPYLVFVLKQFLLQRNLNEVWTGGLSSYALILMVVRFLQVRAHLIYPLNRTCFPCLQLLQKSNYEYFSALVLDSAQWFGRPTKLWLTGRSQRVRTSKKREKYEHDANISD
ncbi:DNA polymerase sigma subunit [Clonorchis sinensis]|uniref:polynucleotide adenylyltransferase n=1 Tax=Clonorchis sinensis TaxID=79923 RepID=G7Y8U2_CLOSI|nr:DNA polymerase sigma subunit [Clonorchis sinensis]